jgi:hypothetical protein
MLSVAAAAATAFGGCLFRGGGLMCCNDDGIFQQVNIIRMECPAGIPAPRAGFGLLGGHVEEMHKVIASVFVVHGYHVGDQARQNVVLETPGQPIQIDGAFSCWKAIIGGVAVVIDAVIDAAVAFTAGGGGVVSRCRSQFPSRMRFERGQLQPLLLQRLLLVLMLMLMLLLLLQRLLLVLLLMLLLLLFCNNAIEVVVMSDQ